jgi:2,4-dienoyl-CoA reductase (NADPH2)
MTNLRDDDWGGDAERRMRFPLEVAGAVRESAGREQAVVYRISGADLVPGGAPQEEVLELARRLSASSVDALNVGIGWHEARVPTVQALVPHGAWLPWVRAIREVVEVPVLASNRINTIALADDVLARGDADFVSLARPFLADPEIVRKARDPSRTVNVCIACNQACIDRSIYDRRVSCVVNPRAGYELEIPHERAGARRVRSTVAVVGGGPAGMEAARALAAAGHRVELLEAAPRLGGQFRMAARIPGKEDFARTIDYFEHELERLGVSVQLGAEPTTAAALENVDAVVLATGVVPRTIELPGVTLPHVVSYADLLLGEPRRARSFAIIGAGGIGLDVAHLLSHHPCADPIRAFHARYGLDGTSDEARRSASPRVTLMCRGPRAARGVGPSTRWAVMAEVKRAGVELITGVEYREILGDSVLIREPGGDERRVPAEMVVVAAGQEPRTALLDNLRQANKPHVVIGGAAGAAELDAERAFREGLHVPQALERALAATW